MRARGVTVLAMLVAVVLTAGVAAARLVPGRDEGSPEKTADDYFAAWSRGALERMRRLVADPPDDFAEQHRALSRGLSVDSISLEPRPAVRSGPDAAQAEFTVTRSLAGRGDWSFRAVLRLARVHRRWRVLWSPATLYPGLKGKGTWTLREVQVPAVALTDRKGRALSADGSLQPYLAGLTDRMEGTDESGWAVEMRDGTGPAQRLRLLGVKGTTKVRTTLDAGVQEAAERAAASRPAAIVALRPSTGEILAVADGLGGLGAFGGHYPPGSTFKVVTAAALLDGGMDAGSEADCPAVVTTAQRTIHNDAGHAFGRTSLREAFAQSCNTTFARLAVEELGARRLAEAARAFGFGVPLTPGLSVGDGSFPDPGSGAELAEAAIGQGRVEATPLLMASVAAAVADGTWRPPRLLSPELVRAGGQRLAEPHAVPGAAALREMMRAVVTGGTAAEAGLPAGVAGKTGTAEFGEGSHAWFIGYRDDLAFCVFVQGGGSGPKVAAPLAARFLRALG
ncbi:penicillin-binding transpeptidase domain-containing protein [Actinomadura roseirufa]|uniref:penicillin-binding transpeptidase domain-containing protein n=1 Tax=Actinomadura roseirufa TaxID=2094049 RepID=UPI0013F14D54|nr:penicillin-binding transpeptidase domain-containing protein [Actinomadura roseirufa]